jgi:homoserine/homoserine lactone efflux protein
MALNDWLSFALLTLAFCLIPGPSVGFTVAYALRHGTLHAIASIAGQLSSNGLYILAVSIGLDRILGSAPVVFTLLKLGGVAYLTGAGVKQWRSPGCRPADGPPECRVTGSAWRGFGRGFLVCGTNPKTFLYYAAILPPFVSPDRERALQLLTLGATAVVVGGAVLAAYALVAGRVRGWLVTRDRLQLRNRISGVLLIGAAIYLAFGR